MCYLIRPGDVVFQIDIIRQVHFGGDRREDESLLPSVWQRELDLAIQTAGTQQSRVQRVLSV